MKKLLTIWLAAISLSVFAQQDSLNVSLLHHWNDTTIPGSFAFNNAYNECWGVEVSGREYAIIGSTIGTHIFDITDIANVTEVFVPGEVASPQIIHRDYHDYAGYLYIVADEGSNSKLKIVDLSQLPVSAPVVYNSSAFFSRSHNIYIDTATAKLYSFGGNNNNGMRVFDLTDPVNPVELVNFVLPQTAHDGFVRNDTAFINDGTGGLFIYDMSNTGSPQLIGSLTTYPQQGYNHSGWLSDDGTIYALADETHGMDIKMLDVSDLGNITVLDTVDSGIDPINSIPHNIIIKGDYMYVSYYYDGLYVYDITDPSNVQTVGYYDTSPLIPAPTYEGAWGVFPYLNCGKVVVSDMQEGLFVLDASAAVNYEYMPTAGFTSNVNGMTASFTSTSMQADSIGWDFDGNLTVDASGDTTSFTYGSAGTYNVCAIAFNVCGSDTICQQVVINPVGLEESELMGVRTYPNPFVNEILIESTVGLQYSLHDVTGKPITLGNITSERTSISTSNMPAGMYLLELKNDNTNITRRLIKNE